MVTNFGKILRRIRVDRDDLLADMAQRIGVSAAFLSKVENGLAKPSDKIVEQIIEKYNITGYQREELEKAKQNITNLTEQLANATAKVDNLTD